MTEFERCRPYLEAALEYNRGTQTIEDVKAGIESGQFQLIAGRNSAALTEIAKLPQKTYINVILGGGDLEELKDIAKRIEDASRAAGADGVMIIGRRGWGKVLEGYDLYATVYVKEHP